MAPKKRSSRPATADVAAAKPAPPASPAPAPRLLLQRLAPLALGVFALGALSGWLARGGAAGGDAAEPPPGYLLREAGSRPYKYIHALLGCEISEPDQGPLATKLRDVVEKQKSRSKVTAASIYFRDLDRGVWTSVNDDEPYAPASLLKVPIMMGYLHLAHEEPALLARPIQYSGAVDHNLKENIAPSEGLAPGRSYSVDQLIEAMIVHSDNNAMELLSTNLDGQSLDDAFVRLGLPRPSRTDTGDWITVKTYASFFRVLYSATYLGKDLSEKALSLLSRAEYDRALAAGIPAGITVAHKFGERAYPQSTKKELHDCGIVYHAKSPYLLCVMTKGTDMDALAETIREVSALVYEAVDTGSATQAVPRN